MAEASFVRILETGGLKKDPKLGTQGKISRVSEGDSGAVRIDIKGHESVLQVLQVDLLAVPFEATIRVQGSKLSLEQRVDRCAVRTWSPCRFGNVLGGGAGRDILLPAALSPLFRRLVGDASEVSADPIYAVRPTTRIMTRLETKGKRQGDPPAEFPRRIISPVFAVTSAAERSGAPVTGMVLEKMEEAPNLSITATST